jgi:hypothetical protein
MADLLAIAVLAVSVLMVFASYRVICKMGFPGWYIVLVILPFTAPFFFLYLAFVEWPIERELTESRKQALRAERQAQMQKETPPLPGQPEETPSPDPEEHSAYPQSRRSESNA